MDLYITNDGKDVEQDLPRREKLVKTAPRSLVEFIGAPHAWVDIGKWRTGWSAKLKRCRRGKEVENWNEPQSGEEIDFA